MIAPRDRDAAIRLAAAAVALAVAFTRRGWVMGIFTGAGFLTWAPLHAVPPSWGWPALPEGPRTPARQWVIAALQLADGFVPCFLFSFGAGRGAASCSFAEGRHPVRGGGGLLRRVVELPPLTP